MSATFTEASGNEMLKALSALIDAGGRAGSMLILDESNRTLAELKFRYPCALEPEGATMHFKPLQTDQSARAGGKASVARVQDAAGRLVFEMDCGDERSDAGVRLNSTTIAAGSPVSLTSFKLSFRGEQ